MIGQLLCMFGFHKMQEVLDPTLTELWTNWCQGTPMKPTPCTYLVCKRCGYDYESRTVGFNMTIKEQPDE